MITAAAVMKLVEAGVFGLDDRVWTILGADAFIPPDLDDFEPELFSLTVRHLLGHRGPWCRDPARFSAGTAITSSCQPGFDYNSYAETLARTTGDNFPVSRDDFREYWNTLQISYRAGTTYNYSNYGYMLLGEVIEAASGMRYETYVRRNILEPLGMLHTYGAGNAVGERVRGEVYHYDGTPPPDSRLAFLHTSDTLVPRVRGSDRLVAGSAALLAAVDAGSSFRS